MVQILIKISHTSFQRSMFSTNKNFAFKNMYYYLSPRSCTAYHFRTLNY